MATQEDLDIWLIEALRALGGSGTVIQVSKYVWEQHETELRASGDLFYKWQYVIRWSANRMRRKKTMKSVEESPPHLWELAH
jgi:hypothetical protein